MRKSRGITRIPKRLPTQREIATTWTTRAPIASEWEPPAAAWLWNTGEVRPTIARSVKSRSGRARLMKGRAVKTIAIMMI